MGLRFSLAKATGAVLTWGLRKVARRPAGNTPGKVALYLDPELIAHARTRLARGSMVVVGTNGKTTVTNLVADAIEAAGMTVACNRSGANLDSGVATALLQTSRADWGVFESDELWLARIIPQLKPDYVVLLNLFRDQEDRMGGRERIRQSIAAALAQTPGATLIYTADDPQCAAIAAAVENPRIALGLGEGMGLVQLGASERQACPACGEPLAYAQRQYDQLGNYSCSACGFARPSLDILAHEVQLGARGLRFAVAGDAALGRGADEPARVHYGEGAPYLVYNLLAAFAAARAAGVPPAAFQRAADAFNPQNGRLQRYEVDGRPVLLNLAKNPAGFNENLRLILADGAPKAVAFFVNNRVGDGRDASWINDVDFEALAAAEGEMRVFAGGLCGDDLLKRLEKAGLCAQAASGVGDVLAVLPQSGLAPHATLYVIANYTALPEAKAVLDRK